jgi:hypothetical protein
MISVTGFDGKQHKFNYSKNRNRKFRNKTSSLHREARLLISQEWPYSSVYEEVTLPGSKKLGMKSLLYADFFIPDLMTVIEVHGEQHYKMSHFFYRSQMEFVNAKMRDRNKADWCDLNEIRLIVLPYNERQRWTEMLKS